MNNKPKIRVPCKTANMLHNYIQEYNQAGYRVTFTRDAVYTATENKKMKKIFIGSRSTIDGLWYIYPIETIILPTQQNKTKQTPST